jgi:hypothetical protein
MSTRATLVGGEDAARTLRPLKTTASGALVTAVSNNEVNMYGNDAEGNVRTLRTNAQGELSVVQSTPEKLAVQIFGHNDGTTVPLSLTPQGELSVVQNTPQSLTVQVFGQNNGTTVPLAVTPQGELSVAQSSPEKLTVQIFGQTDGATVPVSLTPQGELSIVQSTPEKLAVQIFGQNDGATVPLALTPAGNLYICSQPDKCVSPNMETDQSYCIAGTSRGPVPTNQSAVMFPHTPFDRQHYPYPALPTSWKLVSSSAEDNGLIVTVHGVDGNYERKTVTVELQGVNDIALGDIDNVGDELLWINNLTFNRTPAGDAISVHVRDPEGAAFYALWTWQGSPPPVQVIPAGYIGVVEKYMPTVIGYTEVRCALRAILFEATAWTNGTPTTLSDFRENNVLGNYQYATRTVTGPWLIPAKHIVFFEMQGNNPNFEELEVFPQNQVHQVDFIFNIIKIQ